MMSLAKVHWTRRVALVLTLTVGILSGGQGRFAVAAPQIIETTITKDRLAGADFGALPPGIDTVKLILNGPYDPKTNPKGYTGSAIYPPEGSIWKKTVDAQGRHVYQVAVTSATDNSLLATVMYCPEGGSGGSCTPGPGCGVGFGGSNQCGGSSSIMAQPTATNTVAERLAKSEPGGGINLPRMIAGKTFPNIKNINHIPHRTISVTVQPDNSKKSDVLGYLTLKITGKGAALYHKSLKTPLTEDTQIPVSPKKLTEKFYIVTNDEFTEPITIQSFFAFADSNGNAITAEEASACSKDAKATQCCMGGLGHDASGGGGGCDQVCGTDQCTCNTTCWQVCSPTQTGGTGGTGTDVSSTGGDSGYGSSSLHSPQNTPAQDDPCSSNSATASTSAVRSSTTGTKNKIYPEDLNFGNGAGRLVREWPFVTYIMGETSGTLVVIFGNEEKYWFNFNGTTETYTARYGAKATLVYDKSDADNPVFVFTKRDGTVYTFNDLGEDETDPQGLFYQSVAPGGKISRVTQYVDVTGEGMLDRIGEITRYEIVSGTAVATQKLSYNFNNTTLGVIDLLQDVTIQTSTNNGTTWTPIRKVSFTYYGPSNMHGDDTDVKMIVVSEPNDQNGWNTVRTQYYRYWNSNDADFDTKGFKHALKYAFDPEAYVKLVAQYPDPNEATDSQVATFATHYYEYDPSYRRVTRHDQLGGTRSSTFTYVNIADPEDEHYNANYADGANNWKMKTVETWMDTSQATGSQTVTRTTYTNYLSQALIQDFTWGTSHWIDYYHYDSNNRLTLHAEPSAVAGYTTAANGDDVLPPLGTIQVGFKLDGNIEAKVGLVHVYTYDDAGNLAYQYLKQGNAGAEVELHHDAYTSHTAGGATVYARTTSCDSLGEAGTGNITTSYAYTYHTGTNAIAERVTTLPAVSEGHNGTNISSVRKEYLDISGRVVWSKDERGSFTYNTYDSATGAIVQAIQDVKSGQGLTSPSGWGDLPSTGLHLVTDYTHDSEGRITQTLGPANNVDGIQVRTASWTVYDDANHTTRTAQGYQVVSTGAYTLVNPVSITKTDADGRVTEQIQAVRGSNVTSSGALSASDTFAQSSYVRWSVNTYANKLLTASRVYHLIPSSGEGTSGTNYAESSYAYNSVGRLVKTVAPNGTIYRNGLDVRGHVIWTKVGTTEENLVLLTENQYDGGGCSCGANGNMTQATRYADASTTRVTQYTYDWRDRRLTSSTSDGTTTYITLNTYDNLNRITQVDQYHSAAQDANLVARSKTYYDELSRVYKTERYPVTGGTVGTALATNFWYDASGNRTMMTDPLSRQTTWEYDSLSRVAKETQPDPDGNGSGLAPWTIHTYDAASNLLSTTDRLDHTTTFGYDAIGRKISSTDPNNGATLFTFDAAGNMATLTDPVNNTTSWVYDHLGRITQETNALNASRTFEYDVSGNLVKKTDRRGLVTEYSYDYLNRRSAELWKDGTTTTRTFAYTYDRVKMLTTSDPAASFTYAYDGVGRVTSVSESITGLTPTVTLVQQYNTLGRRSQLAASLGETADFVNNFSYDGLGRMSSVVQSGVTGGNAVAEKRIDFAYDNADQFSSVIRYNNQLATQTVAASTYSFDLTGHLTTLTHAKGNSNLASYTWTFDAANRMTGQVSALDGTASYTNDAASQLTGATYTYQPSLDAETYVYDANGNRTNNNYTVGTNNRMTSDGVYTYTYDAEGNRTARVNNSTGVTTRYTWDYRNRLVLVAEYADSNLSTLANKTTEYTYDYLNRWVTRVIDSDGDMGTTTVQQSVFLYDGNQLVGQLAATGGIPSLAHRYLWGPTVDQILADENVSSQNTAGSVLWPLTDHLDTVRDLATYNSGTDTTTISNHRVYNAFGKVTSETNSSVTCLFGFTARPFDIFTGLQNNLNRWYDSAVGRWLSEDPIGYGVEDFNLYRYCGNIPINQIDPSGLKPSCIPDHVELSEDGFVKYIKTLTREQVDQIRNALRKECPTLWEKWKKAEKYAKIRNVAKRTSGKCLLAPLDVYSNTLRFISWINGNDEYWYEDDSEIPLGAPYNNIWDEHQYIQTPSGPVECY